MGGMAAPCGDGCVPWSEIDTQFAKFAGADEFMDQSEASSALVKLGLTAEAANMAFVTADTNGDGKLSSSEFQNYVCTNNVLGKPCC
eukprot:NODE_856_length_758_cov_417.988717_g585_i0.p1 GENE.NODE_856_length_758_cov_417.988717_g585_i0~~NODE_856_length_758_cov_417.988717_g585_i0.p1  ORF type:complete len:95 (-),score=30.70 NODE_856_length_758_cov_417.988717_g585_i0:472-732(-)